MLINELGHLPPADLGPLVSHETKVSHLHDAAFLSRALKCVPDHCLSTPLRHMVFDRQHEVARWFCSRLMPEAV